MKTLEHDNVRVFYDDDSNGEFRYGLVVDYDDENTMWFRHEDGMWIWMRRGQFSTVDLQSAVDNEMIEEWDREGWVPRKTWEMLDELRKM